jgi:hypothetical protein
MHVISDRCQFPCEVSWHLQTSIKRIARDVKLARIILKERHYAKPLYAVNAFPSFTHYYQRIMLYIFVTIFIDDI